MSRGPAGADLTLSIVLCTYNRAARLEQTLEAMNALTMPANAGLDLIVVDNNSRDDTIAVCEQFAARTRLPFRCCTEIRQGLSHARNRGLAETRGSIVIFTDDDITVPADWAVEYARTFEAYEADCVFGRIVPEWNGVVPAWYDGKFSAIYGALDYGPVAFVVTTRNREFFGANFACRKELLERIGGFDPSLGRTPEALYISEERKIFLTLFRQGCKVVYQPSIWVAHNISPEMKTKAYVQRYYRDTATSLVNITDPGTRRQLFGIPFFRLRESAEMLMLFPGRAIMCAVTGRFNRLFSLRLETGRTLRMLRLYVRRYLARA